MAKEAIKKKVSRRGKAAVNADGQAAFQPGEAAAPAFFDAEAVANELGAWWLSGTDKFLKKNPDGRWHEFTQQSLIDEMRNLPNRIINITNRVGEKLSEAKQVLVFLRQFRALDGVLHSLPGYWAGFHQLPNQEMMLVKTSPTLIEPAQGEWPTIRRIVEGMLGGNGANEVDQRPLFWSLAKCWESSFRGGNPIDGWKKCHAVIFVGPDGTGKNLVQELILTPLVGGRFANPRKWLMGEDEFNADVMVEHFALSELPGSQRMEERTKFAEVLKEIIANHEMRARLMRSDPTRFAHHVRISISVNDDPNTMRQLPLVASGFGDKINIFMCKRSVLPMVGDGLDASGQEIDFGEDGAGAERALRQAIAKEMPAFIYWLRNEWQIPEDLVKLEPGKANPRRFGFRSWHHPSITSALYEETPAAQLLRIIDMAEFRENHSDDQYLRLWQLQEPHNHQPLESRARWWGTAEQLEQLLTGRTALVSSVVDIAKKLFSHTSAQRLLADIAAKDRTDAGIEMARVVKDDKLTKTRAWRGYWVQEPIAI